MTQPHKGGVMTLRKLIELVGDEFLDAELSVSLVDPHLNTAWSLLPTSLESMPRSKASPSTGEPARLTLRVRLDDVRFVKMKKQGAN